jgi:hypothetical protein
MRLTRVRFTVRRLMVAVAAAGAMSAAVAAIRARSERFRSLAEYHAARVAMWSRGSEGRYRVWVDWRGERVSRAASGWHADLAGKYERAARHPWLSVAPDPPEPK